MRTWALITTALLLSFYTCIAKSQELTINISASKSELIVGEPVKLVVEIYNTSDEILRILPVERLGMNMEAMFLRIITPDQRTEYRKFTFTRWHEIVNPYFPGEILAPGEVVVTLLYPTETRAVRFAGDDTPKRGYGRTFPKPGVYEVQLAYVPPPRYERLYRTENTKYGEVYSNSIFLALRAPSQKEKEILDAYWNSGDKVGLLLGDDHPYLRADEKLLEQIIAKYPREQLTDYLRLALARSFLFADGLWDGADHAIPLLEEIIDSAPNFRFEETRLHLATAYSRAGLRKNASALFETIIKARPAMKCHAELMGRKIMNETDDIDNILEWKESRMRGEHGTKHRISYEREHQGLR